MIARLSAWKGDERDAGVYAILYAILVLVVMGLVALVVDIGALRQDRRNDRVLTDNAALAGTNALGDQPPDALAACRAAWESIRVNLGAGKTAGTTNCATFPKTTAPAFDACPTTAMTATGSLSHGGIDYTVAITWPVPDDSTLMTQPDIRPQAAGFSQTTVEQDGNACKRLGVTIGHKRNLLFASALGYHASATADHSVALLVRENGNGGEPAPLVILDPHACEALVAKGGGGVLVGANNDPPPTPGMIAVDSDGSECTGGSSVIDSNSSSSISCTPATYSTTTQCPSAIWAEDTKDGQKAGIYAYALDSGTALPAYQTSQVTCTTSALPDGPTGALCPAPTPSLSRIGRGFIDDVYNCTGATCDASHTGIPRLQQFVNGFTMTGNCSTDTYPGGFTCVDATQTCDAGTCTASPSTDQCKSATPNSYTGQNVFVDCPSFTVKSGTVAFPGVTGGGGTVVFAGDVSVSGSGACLAFNDNGGMCTSPTLADEPTDGPVVYIAGSLSTSSGGTFIAPQTFVMLGSCNPDGTTCTQSIANVNMQDNKAGSILWSAPMGPLLSPTPTTCTNATPPSPACFAKTAVACHRHGTTLSRVLPRSWDHLVCQSWDHRRVVRRRGLRPPLPLASGRSIWRGDVAFREVRVSEVREVLRCWLVDPRAGLRTIAERAGVDRKTARRYVEAAEAAGLVRDGGVGQLSDELVGAVIATVRPARASGHGESWEALLPVQDDIRGWLKAGLQLTNVHGKLARRGVDVPYRTLHRFAVARCGFGRRQPTVRVVDGEPGAECQLDFGRLGLIADPQAGRRRVLHALVFTAVYSRHMFVWLSFHQTLAAVIDGCEAAWGFFGGVFRVLIPDNLTPVVPRADAINPTFSVGWLDYAQARGFVTDPARVRSPRDKPRVERVVPFVRNNFFAGETFLDRDDAQRRVEHWCRITAGLRIHGTTAARPAELFAEAEASLLLPVTGRYDVPVFSTPLVARDFHIEVARALYSVPFAFIGQRVEARADSRLVKVFHRGQLIKTHPRKAPGQRSSDPADFPVGKADYALRDVTTLKNKAAAAGPAVGIYAARLLDTPLPWTKMRTVYRLLGLVRSYGPAAVNAACRQALELDVVDVTKIARLLEQARENDTSPPPAKVIGGPARFARDAAEFRVVPQ